MDTITSTETEEKPLVEETSEEELKKTFIQVRKSDNHIVGYSTCGGMISNDTFDAIEIDQEIDAETLMYSTYEDGKIVYQQDIKDAESAEKIKAEAVEEGIELFNQLNKQAILIAATEAQAFTMRYLYDEWKEGVDYIKGDRFMYNDKFWKVNQDHMSQADWIPGAAPSLYTEISDPNEEWPAWKQPTMAEDAYSKGDKVTFEGKHYISLIDANVWSPTAYPAGWQSSN